MKKHFLHSFFILSIITLFFACNNNSSTDDNAGETDSITTVQPASPDTAQDGVVTEEQTEPKEEPVTKPKTAPKTPAPETTQDETPKTDWRTMMAEYHDILCRAHKGQGTTDDKIRQAELTRALAQERKKLASSEQFTFAAEMARAMNMETCK